MDVLLAKAKMVLRITCSDFDEELTDLILAGLADLGIVGVDASGKLEDPLVIRAVMTFVKLSFGDLNAEDYERLREAYEAQRGTLYMSTGYTDWGDEE
jgi:hypothetical protein